MQKGFTIIEGLVVGAIFAIIVGIIYQQCAVENADPELVVTNALGQQTWKIPVKRLAEFQEKHHRFKVISMTAITGGTGRVATTTGYMIVIEPMPEPEAQAEAEQK